MMQKFISIIFSILFLLTLVSCNSTETTASTSSLQTTSMVAETTVPLSAYEQLSEDEKEVFDALIIALNSYARNPSSARVIMAGSKYSSANFIELKLYLENAFGGGTNKCYFLVYETGPVGSAYYPKGTLAEGGNVTYDAGDINCAKINKALTEYYGG